MPLNMPGKALITIQKRSLPSDYKMPVMEMAAEHYSLGYIISGDRRIITPYQQFDAHSSDVMAMPPLLYHRTFSLSDRPYTNYLVKISSELAQSFKSEVDAEIWDRIFEKKSFSFSEKDKETIESILEDMLIVYESGRSYSEILLKGALYRLTVFIWENSLDTDIHSFRTKLSDEIMDAMYYIEQHYSEDIRLGDVSAFAGFSDGHFSRLFTAQVGIPFSGYLKNVRIRHAKELLLNTADSVAQIAVRTGFSNGDYLSDCFKKNVGKSPLAFRKEYS